MDILNEYQIRLDELMPLIREQLAANKCVKFSPRGTSMLPMLRQGIDHVVLSPLPRKLKKYDLPLYQRKDGQFVLHRVIQVGETYSCMGDNQFVAEHGLEHTQMIGLVTAFYRDKKEIPVSAFRYRFYCRIWHYSRPVRYFYRRAIGWLRKHITRA